jgi:hypothetical protein
MVASELVRVGETRRLRGVERAVTTDAQDEWPASSALALLLLVLGWMPGLWAIVGAGPAAVTSSRVPAFWRAPKTK